MTGLMPHDDPTLLVHAYLDGELDPINSVAVEQRMADDPALVAEYERVAALRQLLAERLPREAAPAHLRGRISSAIGLRQSRAQPSWRALAASIAVTAVLASGATWLALGPTADNGTADAIVADHIRALMAPQPTDVVTSDQHTVKPWFNGRIPEAPRVVDLAKDDFPLVGARIDVVGRTPVPTLVYRRHRHLISLTAIPGSRELEMAPVHKTMDGYNLMNWTDHGVTYWLVSDVAVSDLDQFCRLFRTTSPATDQ